jgi:meromycolic acid enoyl-[acyl-carrier-protein] reductase
MAIMDGKTVLVTGVLTNHSIAFSVAELIQKNGGTVILSSFGRAMSLTERAAKKLPSEPPIVELDVTNKEHLANLKSELLKHTKQIDGLVHAIGFAPQSALGGNFLNTEWEDVSIALHTSAYSFKSLTMAALDLMPAGSSVVGLDFDATVAWPQYDWMGVAKAALESTSRYMARDLGPKGIRVNLVAAGPLNTVAAKHIPGFEKFEAAWSDRSPLKWSISDPEPSAKAVVALLSDWFVATTAEIIHVDGGYHAMGY